MQFGTARRRAVPNALDIGGQDTVDQQGAFVARVEHRAAARAEVHEQLRLARQVVLPGTVLCDVIARQIREHRQIEAPFTRIAAAQCATRDLDHCVATAALGRAAHGISKPAFVAFDGQSGAIQKVTERRLANYGNAARLPDRRDEMRRRGLAVGAGYAHAEQWLRPRSRSGDGAQHAHHG